MKSVDCEVLTLQAFGEDLREGLEVSVWNVGGQSGMKFGVTRFLLGQGTKEIFGSMC